MVLQPVVNFLLRVVNGLLVLGVVRVGTVLGGVRVVAVGVFMLVSVQFFRL